MIIKKIKSNKGYVFTYEALIVAFIFVSIFYIGYMTYSYNLGTAIEEKRDIEQFHKSLLLKDLFLKKYEFPGNYSEDYIQNFTSELNLQEKTFDPINNFSNDSGKFYFIIHPNEYDKLLDNANIPLNNITLTFNNGETFKIYSNVSGNCSQPGTLNGYTIITFKENVYIPKITGITKNTKEIELYGCNGDHIYFKVNENVTNFSARLLNTTNNENVTISINGVLYEITLNNSEKSINCTQNIKINDINNIRILNSPSVVEFYITTQNNANFYYLTLSPRNVTIMVKP
ncbi:hypothetical protein ACO3TA_02470 [Methanocaldococcus sp. 28A]